MKYFTLVGSRETPEEHFSILKCLSFKLCNQGWIPRSGGADGADTAAEMGWDLAARSPSSHIPDMEIYIPWEEFNGRSSVDNSVILASTLSTYTLAEEMASNIHPAWDKLKQGVKKLHTRNIYQVLGKDLCTPSKFLVCYAKSSGNSVQGGTRTAWECAKNNNIPCFNIYKNGDYSRILNYLEET